MKLQNLNAAGVPTGVLTMSSLEMVSYINKTREGTGEAILRHDNLMARVPKVLGTIAPKFLGTNIYINGRGGKQEQTIYNFPKREAMLVAMSYSYELQAQVFDAWEAAEAALTQAKKPVALIPNFDDPIAAAKAWIVEKENVLALTNEMAVAKPKIAFHDAVVMDGTTYSLAETAKILNKPPRAFNQVLRNEGFLMYNNVAYQAGVNKGWFVLKYSSIVLGDGSYAPATTRVTSKGITHLQKWLAEHSFAVLA